MTRRLWCLTAALAAGCASGSRGTASAPEPGPTPYTPASAQPPGHQPAFTTDIIRYGPSAMRYVVHRRLRIQQSLAGQQQPDTQELGARVFVSTAIAGPADSLGYPATFTVDSIVPDSGTAQPVAQSVSRARRLIFRGRITIRGEFTNAVPSDSGVAQSIVQVVGNFRDFLPRLPGQGVIPGEAWTDTVETTQKGSGSEISRRSIIQATAATWEERAGVRALRVDGSQTYRVSGSGKNAGQPFELTGAGIGSATAFIAADGRYLGGESRDSATLTIRLPVQGVAIPIIQVTRTTVAVLP